MIVALLTLLANGVIEVPAAHWKAIEISVPNHDSTVHCSFEVRTGGTKLQAIFMERSEFERFHRGRRTNSLYETGFEKSARFRYRVPEAGEYVLLLDNRLEDRWPTQASLRIEVTSARDAQITEVPPERRRLIVALSLLFFGAVVAFSARQFLKHAG
jgi:hypothetical protein